MIKTIVFVGSGIKAISHLTGETVACIRKADMVAYIVNNPIMEEWISQNSNKSFSFSNIYFSEKQRKSSYKKIESKIFELSDQYNNLCILIYGHPMILSNAACNSANSKMLKGRDVIVLPGISSIDCLFADLKIDPGLGGCLALDSSDFLLNKKNIDTSCHIVLYQVGLTGVFSTPEDKITIEQRIALEDKLLLFYDENYEVILYEASIYSHIKSTQKKIKIKELSLVKLTSLTTLYIPPV